MKDIKSYCVEELETIAKCRTESTASTPRGRKEKRPQPTGGEDDDPDVAEDKSGGADGGVEAANGDEELPKKKRGRPPKKQRTEAAATSASASAPALAIEEPVFSGINRMVRSHEHQLFCFYFGRLT